MKLYELCVEMQSKYLKQSLVCPEHQSTLLTNNFKISIKLFHGAPAKITNSQDLQGKLDDLLR